MSTGSLVKYDNPVLATDVKNKRIKQNGINGSLRGSMKTQLPPVENKVQVTQTEEILNSIIPPRYVYFKNLLTKME
jgi:dynein light intermediate chain